jgi:hypothetical protein
MSTYYQFSNPVLRRPIESALAAAIRVVNKAAGRFYAAIERHLDRIDRQIGPEVIAHRPADHHPREGIDDSRDI